MEANTPLFRKAVRVTPQLGEIKKIKRSKLPVIPNDFDARTAAMCDKAKACWDSTEEYVRMLVKFHTLAKEAPRSATYQSIVRDNTKADKELEESQKLIYKVRDRCIHSIVQADLYKKLSPIAVDELYLYWATMAEFTVDGGCEYYCLGGRGYSRFFTTNSRHSLETAGLEFEYFSMLKRFANMFQFQNEVDRQVFSLFLDGFETVVISDFIGESETWVRKKLESLKGMAEENQENFLRLSRIEEEEKVQEYREAMGIALYTGGN